MDDLQRVELLVKVAKLYYEDGFNQSEISKILGFSRPYISKMINEARTSGIVSIHIHDSLDAETAMERKLRTRFNLLRVFAVQCKSSENVSAKVGSHGANYISSIIQSGDIMCVGSGNTLMNFANNFPMREDLENVIVVQMDGCMISLSHTTFSQTIPKVIADSINGNPVFFPVPMFLRNKESIDALLRESCITRVVELQKRANIAAFTVGGIGMGKSTSIVQSDFLDDSEVDTMMLNGVVGNIGGHFIKKDGSLYDEQLDKYVLSLPLSELRKKEYRICMASGRSKYEGVFASLCAGYVNVLVVDHEMAQALVMMSNSLL